MRTRAQTRQRAALEAGLLLLLALTRAEQMEPEEGGPLEVNAYELAEELNTTPRTLMRALDRLAGRTMLVYDATPSQGLSVWFGADALEWATFLMGFQD